MQSTYKISGQAAATEVYKSYLERKTGSKRHGMERENGFGRDSFSSHPGLCGDPTLPKLVWDRQYSHLRPGDKIVVRGRFDSPYYRWVPSMNTMLGRKVEIIAIDPRGAVLKHPDQSSHFSFPLESLDYRNTNIHDPNVSAYEYSTSDILKCTDSYDKKGIIKEIKKGNTVYELVMIVELNAIKHTSLDEDYRILYKIYQGMDYLSLEAKYFDAIKEQCPRIIGVLLSSGFMTKSVLEE